MNQTNIKEQIVSLRKEGKTLCEIKRIVECSFSTIAYHLYEKTRRSTRARIRPETKRQYNQTVRGILAQKLNQFRRVGTYHKMMDERKFTINDLDLGNQPTCYLTGDLINLSKASSFSFDHKIPSSKHGTNDLSNLGLCSSAANRAKSNLTETEFVELCKKVLVHHGYTISKSKKS